MANVTMCDATANLTQMLGRIAQGRAALVPLAMSVFPLFLGGCLYVFRITQFDATAQNGGVNGPGASSGTTDVPTCADDQVLLANRCVSAPASSCPNASRTPAGPVLFFTDLTSGPVTGGENDAGVFLTLYGLRFGASRGDSFVSINGVEVARYHSWNPPDSTIESERFNARGLERIVVQPGSAVTSGDIVVVVGGVASNPRPFTVRGGNILFVDPSVTQSGDGSVSAPFKALYELRSPAVAAGDTIYVKSGGAPITAVDPLDQTTHLSFSVDYSPNGSAAVPLAIVGYPGDPPLFGAGPAGEYLDPIHFDDAIEGFVLANLDFSHGQKLRLPRRAVRLVGCRFTDFAPTRWGSVNLRSEARIYGNLFRVTNDNTDNLSTAYGAAADTDIGWNEHRGGQGTAAITLRDMPFEDSAIHDSLIVEQKIDQITFEAAVARVRVFNNIVWNQNFAAILIHASAGPLTIAHNTLVGEGTNVRVLGDAPGGSIALTNNVLSTSNEYVVSDDGLACFAPTNNFYDDTRGGPALPFSNEPGAKLGTAGFTSAVLGNFAPAASSSLVDAGNDTTDVCHDFYGVARPQGAAPDAGAIERP